jgi:hypothetical protein
MVADCVVQAWIGHSVLNSVSLLLVCRRIACTNRGSVLGGHRRTRGVVVGQEGANT